MITAIHFHETSTVIVCKVCMHLCTTGGPLCAMGSAQRSCLLNPRPPAPHEVIYAAMADWCGRSSTCCLHIPPILRYLVSLEQLQNPSIEHVGWQHLGTQVDTSTTTCTTTPAAAVIATTMNQLPLAKAHVVATLCSTASHPPAKVPLPLHIGRLRLSLLPASGAHRQSGDVWLKRVPHDGYAIRG